MGNIIRHIKNDNIIIIDILGLRDLFYLELKNNGFLHNTHHFMG